MGFSLILVFVIVSVYFLFIKKTYKSVGSHHIDLTEEQVEDVIRRFADGEDLRHILETCYLDEDLKGFLQEDKRNKVRLSDTSVEAWRQWLEGIEE